MKQHTITFDEIAVSYKVQLAAYVDAVRGKKTLTATFVPGSKVLYVVEHGGDAHTTYNVDEAIAVYNSTVL